VREGCSADCGVAESWDGFVSPCNLDVDMALKVGNIVDIKDIGKLDNCNEWVNSLSNIKKKENICKNCFDGNNRINRDFYKK
jgi:radical SAM protein with 4Fe4S-binding SPASM domain